MRPVYAVGVADGENRPAGTRRRSEFVHNISVRFNDEQHAVAESFRQCFDPPTHTEAFRWLFNSVEGREFIDRKIRGEI